MTAPEQDPLFQRGKALHEARDFPAAIQVFEALVARSPDVAIYHARLARCLSLNGSGETDRAMQEASQALELDASCADAYLARGNVKDDKGDLEGALADYTEAIRLQPDDASAYNNRGNTKRNKGDLEGALADYTEAIRLQPDYAVAYCNRGIMKHNKGDLEGALADYTEAIRLQPDYASAYYNRGIMKHNKGDLEGALTDRARAYVFEPKGRISTSTARFQPWYVHIHQHFTTVLLPDITRHGEKFVEYYPCGLLWGRQESVRRRLDGSAYNVHLGRYGTGYICLTDKSLHLITFVTLTKAFPMYSSGPKGFFGHLLRDVDEVTPETTDQSWTVPWQSIAAVQPSTDTRRGANFITIVSGPIWEIYEHFEDDKDILVALNMGKAGRLARIWSGDDEAGAHHTSAPAAPAQADIFDALKKLDELRKAGIVTDAEFEAKKQELLKRL